MIKIRNVSMTFDEEPVFHNVNLDVRQGDLICLLGENGCGKSTLLSIISGKLVPTRGSVELNRKLVYQPQKMPLFEDMTCIENMQCFADILKIKISNNDLVVLLKKLKLNDKQNTNISRLSGGERQRLGLAVSLLQNGDIYIFDEAESAMDAAGREIFRSVIQELKNKAVIWISHHVGESIGVAKRILYLTRAGIKEVARTNLPFNYESLNDRGLMNMLEKEGSYVTNY